MFILASAFVGRMPLVLSYSGLPRESRGWTVFGTRKMGCGGSGIVPA